MKKITFLLAFVAVAAFANAADWVETFGPDDAAKNASNYWPYVSGTAENYVYTTYDHAADCTYEGYSASVRQVAASTTTGAAAIGNHVWLTKQYPISLPTYPEVKEAWLSISGIVADGAQYLSFDLAPNVDNYTPNIKVWLNSVEVTLPAIVLATTNVMQHVTVAIPTPAAAYSFKLQNFDEAQGFRIDNVKFSATTAIKNVTIDNSVYATNGTVYAEGEFQIFSVAGQNVTELNGQLNGIYVVKTAKGIQKVAVK